MTTTFRRAELWVGSIDLLNGRLDAADVSSMLAVQLPALEESSPVNTLLIDLDDTPVQVRLVGRDRRPRWRGGCRLRQIFEDLTLGRELRSSIASLLPGTVGGGLASWVPLFYVSWTASGHDDLHFYSVIRFTLEDALFVRTSPHPYRWVGDELFDHCGERVAWLDEAVALHEREATFLNNHQCYYRKCFPGVEVEHKLTLDPNVDIWELTALAYERLRAGALPGFILEYRDEFQAWDYVNHLFEVSAPPSDRGYVSFIPTTDGRFTIKRKWFEADALARREEHYPAEDVAEPLEQVIERRFGVAARRLPTYRRVRYDVNFESTRTGHVYGIFFDHCSLLEPSAATLAQCEVEYLRTRSALPPDQDEVLPELERVTAWTEALLDAVGVPHRRGFYSKLSFLRDVVRARPELAVGPT